MAAKGCSAKQSNTGKSRCQYDWGLFKRVIVLPKGTEFNGENFDEWLMAGIHAKNPAERFYPMPMFTDNADNSEDAVTWTNGYGQQYTIREGNMAFTQSYEQDYCMTNRLRTFNDQVTREFLVWDGSGRIWGVKTETGFKGFTGKMFAMVSKPTPADSLSEPTISYTFTQPSELSKKGSMDTDLDPEDVDGLENVELNIVKENTSYRVTMSAECGGSDVTSEMAALTAKECWMTGSAKADTEVTAAPTWDATNGCFVFSGLTAGNKLALASPDVMYAHDVKFKEGANEVSIP